jgi:hypothetical protein
MQIFRGFENEKSILEIVRQVKIASKMLRTELRMSVGVSTDFFFSFRSGHSDHRSALPHGTSINISGRSSNNGRINSQRAGFIALF